MRLVPTVSDHEALLAKAVRGLEEITARNEYGFPLGIYRADLLPLHDYAPEEESIEHLYRSLPSAVRSTLTHGPLGAAPPGTRHDSDEVVIDDEEVIYGGESGVLEGTDPSDRGDEGEGIQTDSDTSAEPAYLNDPGDGEGDALFDTSQSLVSTPSSDRVAGFRRKDLVNAYVPLSYEEGFPTLPNGQTYWDRFEFEPMDAYTCFQAYLQMPSVCSGTRSVRDLPAVMVNNELLDMPPGAALEEYIHRFKTFMQIYGWASRARAFDLYRAASYRKQMEQRAMEVQDSHFGASSRLMGKLLNYLESEEDFWDMMTPKVGIDMFKTLAQVQRISTGLPASAPQNPAAEDKSGESFEMILRTLAQKGRGDVDDEGMARSDARLSSQILEDPTTTRIAQELILRLGHRQGS